MGLGLLPLGPARRQQTALHIVERLLIHRDQTRTRAGLDGHVADRHAPFHAERADGTAGEFDGVTRTAGRSDPADDGQHQVLGRHARGEVPSTFTSMFFAFLASRV